MNAAARVIVALAFAIGAQLFAKEISLEATTYSLLVRGKSIKKTSDDLESLTFSVRNTRDVPVYVSLASNDTFIGLCYEFSHSSLPFLIYEDAGGGKWRVGRLLRPGEEMVETLTTSKECLREDNRMIVTGSFVVGWEPGRVRSESFALGTFYVERK